MKCPECQKKGKRSHVFFYGSYTTLIAAHPYYDEDGNYHANNPNISSASYSCSNGHRWTEESGGTP